MIKEYRQIKSRKGNLFVFKQLQTMSLQDFSQRTLLNLVILVEMSATLQASVAELLSFFISTWKPHTLLTV